MENTLQHISHFVQNTLVVYSAVLMASYILLGLISIFTLRKYLKTSKHTDYIELLPNVQVPAISLIAPAYNEGLTIVENIRSLVSLHYANFEVIIVNDGSSDDTLLKATKAYKMEKIEMEIRTPIPSKEIRGIYRSSLPEFKNLLLIDKVNGGKSDALNTGINVSSSKYVACIDVDCILEQDSLLKLVKPFLSYKEKVIATGGVIRIINSCEIKNGSITKITVPKSWIARMQVLEYLRAFLLGRVAWGNLDGLLLISGAFGMFDKDIVIAAGGYSTTTVGEDMELVVRMRRYMVEHKIPYRVEFIPDPLCWTEAPESTQILGRQRNRWTRGTIETLWYHRIMFFNPKYGVIGMLSYPYWFFFEFLAPIIETLGLAFCLLAGFMGWINWEFFYAISLMIYAFVIFISLMAIYVEEFTYCQYKSSMDIIKLVGSALVEPFIYHPFFRFTPPYWVI